MWRREGLLNLMAENIALALVHQLAHHRVDVPLLGQDRLFEQRA